MITVVGEHAGREVVSFALAHGEDPVAGLRARGWQAVSYTHLTLPTKRIV